MKMQLTSRINKKQSFSIAVTGIDALKTLEAGLLEFGEQKAEIFLKPAALSFAEAFDLAGGARAQVCRLPP